MVSAARRQPLRRQRHTPANGGTIAEARWLEGRGWQGVHKILYTPWRRQHFHGAVPFSILSILGSLPDQVRYVAIRSDCSRRSLRFTGRRGRASSDPALAQRRSRLGGKDGRGGG